MERTTGYSKKIFFILGAGILVITAVVFAWKKGYLSPLIERVRAKEQTQEGQASLPTDELAEPVVYATSHIETEETEYSSEEVGEEVAEENFPSQTEEESFQPLTDEVVKLRDLYTQEKTEVTLRSFYPGASYTWEKYNLQTKEWEEAESELGTDELNRQVSLCSMFCETSSAPIMVRCTASTEDQEYIDVAAIHVLSKPISGIAAEPYIANTGSYLSAKDIPVKITYSDNTTEEITGLYGLYWIQEEEHVDYSESISGNMVETVTTVLTDMEYQYIELGEKESLMRYRINDSRIDVPVTIEGKDLLAPDILKVELGEYEIRSVDEPVPIQVTVTAVDNHTLYTELFYCFLPKGVEPKEEDWHQNSSWEQMIDQNGIWVAHVRDDAGNVAVSEREIIAVDQKAPTMKVSLENTDWCEETRILVEASDNLDVLYSFSCPETGEDSGWIEAAEYLVKHNGIWNVSAKDSLGNTQTREIEVRNIDKEMPIIEQITVTTTNAEGEDK